MIVTRNRLVALFAYAAAAGAGFACTAILAPKDDVQRCSTADDCDATGDPRYVAECRFDPESNDLDATQVDKICVASFKVVGCDPSNPADALGMAFEMHSVADRYTMCPTDADAPKGCEPPGGFQCAAGLSVNELGVCDDGQDEMPAYRLDLTNDLTRGQDIVDAYCQSFFCEGDWVCDRAGGNTCVRCDPDLPIGEGGCGTVYIAGAPSCIYPGAALSCGDGDTDLDEPRFGACTP